MGTDNHEIKDLLLDLRHDVSELKRDVSELKHDVSELKHDMVIVKKDISGLKSDVSKLQDHMESVRSYIKHSSNAQEVKFTQILFDKLSPLYPTYRPLLLPWKNVYTKKGIILTDLDGAILYGNCGLLASPTVISKGRKHRTRNHGKGLLAHDNSNGENKIIDWDSINLAIDDGPVSQYRRQYLYVLEGKSYVDKCHVDKKMKQMLTIRDEILREVRKLDGNIEKLSTLSGRQYKEEWKDMIRENKFLLKIDTDLIHLVFGTSYVAPKIKRYIDRICANMDKDAYERIAFSIASSMPEYQRVTRSITPLPSSFQELRTLCQPQASADQQRLFKVLTPYEDLEERFQYFKGAIGYIDEKSSSGLVPKMEIIS
jgi:regulator of replication initiation timing